MSMDAITACALQTIGFSERRKFMQKPALRPWRLYTAGAVLAILAITIWIRHVPHVVLETESIQKSILAAESSTVCNGLDDPSSVYCAAKAVQLLDLVSMLPRSRCTQTSLIEKWTACLTDGVNQQRPWLPHAYLRSKAVVEWDVLQPFVTCPGETRVGYIGDGGKWVCRNLDGDITIPPQQNADKTENTDSPPCIVYSFGVRTDSSYEDEVVARFGCRIWEFDPSPGLTAPSPKFPQKTTFTPWGLRARDEVFPLMGEQVQGYALESIMRRMGHEGKTLDMLKVDIEGSEWDVLQDLVARDYLPFHQLQLELHFDNNAFDSAKVVRLVVQLLERGFLPFHKELNGFDPKFTTEISFVSLAWLKEIEPACAS